MSEAKDDGYRYLADIQSSGKHGKEGRHVIASRLAQTLGERAVLETDHAR